LAEPQELHTTESKKWRGQRKNAPNTILENLKKKMLKYYGHAVCMEDDKWPVRIDPGHRKEDEDEDELK